jgi:histidyl-tRNA synthetase
VEPESLWAKRPAPSPKPLTACGGVFTAEGFNEIILPSLWEQRTFNEKAAGAPVLSQMWAFQDKKGREVCLIPEATGIIQELYREQWDQSLPKPIRLFYITSCYRYERPQAGRYREFTQVGVEILGLDTSKEEAVAVPPRFLPPVPGIRALPSGKRWLPPPCRSTPGRPRR